MTSQLIPISSNQAPKAIGPYSQAILVNQFLFLSGQLPLDPEQMKIVATDVEGQVRQILANIRAVLQAGGATLRDVVKATVFMQDLADFPKMNGVYEAEFGDHKPARSTFQVARLPMDALVEIEVIVFVPPMEPDDIAVTGPI